jgi:hypothetical protein
MSSKFPCHLQAHRGALDPRPERPPPWCPRPDRRGKPRRWGTVPEMGTRCTNPLVLNGLQRAVLGTEGHLAQYAGFG